MTIEPQLKALCKAAVENVMREVKGAKAALICTEDGFEVAAQVENNAQVSRLSAMASSFSALGALVGEESQLGACKYVLVDAEGGLILILQARNPQHLLTLCIVTSSESVAGQVLYFAKQAAQTLVNA
jgi:uncharacterized protein